MTDHRNRMLLLGLYAGPREGSSALQALKVRLDEFAKDSHFKKEMAKRFGIARRIVEAQMSNGAGLAIDVLLRDFLLEYCDRNFKFGLHSLPSSFNILEAFYEYRPDLSVFVLRPEKDHILSFAHFLDYATSIDAANNLLKALQCMEEGVIYSYNASNNPDEITFSLQGGQEYGIGTAALVRHGNEVSILLVTGEKIQTNEMTLRLLAESKELEGGPVRGRENLKPDPERKLEAVPLMGNKNFWQTLVLARMDLDKMTYDGRYILKDQGIRYEIVTDDTQGLVDATGESLLGPNFEEKAKELFEIVEQYGILFELCKTVLHLPLYFEKFVTDITYEQHPTGLLIGVSKTGKPKYRIDAVEPRYKIPFRNVAVLDNNGLTNAPERMFYKAPDLRMEVSGYWKNLLPSEVGADKHGKPIHGKTWVQKNLSWVQVEGAQKTILAQGHQEQSIETTGGTTRTKEYIYVMRMAAHAKDVFKIGRTSRDPEARADDLSAETGSPDKYLVVQEWIVSNSVAAEQRIHEVLADHRMNPHREFFQAPYSRIRQAIEDVLFEMAGSSKKTA